MLCAAYPHLGIGYLGVSLAFGVTVLTMVYAVGRSTGVALLQDGWAVRQLWLFWLMPLWGGGGRPHPSGTVRGEGRALATDGSGGRSHLSNGMALRCRDPA